MRRLRNENLAVPVGMAFSSVEAHHVEVPVPDPENSDNVKPSRVVEKIKAEVEAAGVPGARPLTVRPQILFAFICFVTSVEALL